MPNTVRSIGAEWCGPGIDPTGSGSPQGHKAWQWSAGCIEGGRSLRDRRPFLVRRSVSPFGADSPECPGIRT